MKKTFDTVNSYMTELDPVKALQGGYLRLYSLQFEASWIVTLYV